ncbi:MAG TPA: hypothetical protein VGV93_03750 [Acidimicrobiales bacterium]|nr:hypothetical protein [Acidimicrobiales bacterium]
MPDIDQTLREWQFQGGPTRTERWAGEHPTAYAVVRAAFLGLLWTPLLWMSFREAVLWVTLAAGVLIVFGGATGFIIVRRETRHATAALKQWESRQRPPS